MKPEKNYIDEKGNYHNVQNFTLTQIYDSGVEEGCRITKQHGKWILNNEFATCPFCNTEYRNFEGQIKKFRFCPWCGAELEVTNNE